MPVEPERKLLPMKSASYFDGVGHCIYCHAHSYPLTDEHIVPYSLGGATVIRRASCGECQKVTSYLERKICRDHLGDFREALNFPTYRPGRRSGTIRGSLSPIGEGHQIEYRWDRFPAFAAFPVLEEPGIMIGRKPNTPIKVSAWTCSVGGNREANPGLVSKPLRLDHWLRFVAKVCHSGAYGCLGASVADYEQFLPDVILGKTKDPSYFVGGEPSIVPAERGESFSSYFSGELRFIKRFSTDGRECLIVSYRVFSDAGSPAYQAAFGQKRIGLLPMAPIRLREPNSAT